MRTLRLLHKWLGLLVFLQVLVWMGSGFLISLFDSDIAAGRTTMKTSSDPSPLSRDGLLAMTDLPIEREGLENVRLFRIGGAPVYRLQSGQGVRLFHAQTGEPFTIDGRVARRIARGGYGGTGEVSAVERLEARADIVNFEGAAWRVAFDDELGTRVYIDAADGRLLGHRNSRSALQEFLLELHFMDYDGGHDFNNPLIIGFAFFTLWLAVSGVLLLISSLRRVGFR